jgi:hypothetical protein
MKRSNIGDRDIETLSADEHQRIAHAMQYRFNAYLRPGESITIDAERDDDYVYSTLAVEAADESFRLELEAAVLAADQGVEEFVHPQEALNLGFELLKRQLYEFFQSNREERFHVDWRQYTIDQTEVRFRGRIHRPELERRADEMLDESDLDETDEAGDSERDDDA